MANFEAQVAQWVRDTEGALDAVFHESTQRVVDKMQTPRGQGGNMPVDTGYLWHSLVASTSTMPQIRPDGKGALGATYSYDSSAVGAVIATAQLGDKIYCGYTAVYAAFVNYKGALFVEQAVQQWPAIVKQVEAELATRGGR